MLWSHILIFNSSIVYASTCQHEAMNYGNSPMQMSRMNFRMLPIMVWGMVVVDSCLQSQPSSGDPHCDAALLQMASPRRPRNSRRAARRSRHNLIMYINMGQRDRLCMQLW